MFPSGRYISAGTVHLIYTDLKVKQLLALRRIAAIVNCTCCRDPLLQLDVKAACRSTRRPHSPASFDHYATQVGDRRFHRPPTKEVL
jgi:hypothetical protein